MSKISLSFYSIKVLKPEIIEGKEKYIGVKLGNNKLFNISKYVYEFLKNKSSAYDNDTINEKIYKPTHIETNTYYVNGNYLLSSVSAIILSGNYGIEMDIVDPAQNITVYNQKKEQAGVIPFGFSIFFSNEIQTALLVIQSFGAKGMSKKIKEIITHAVNEHNADYQVQIKSIIPAEYFTNLMENENIKNIYFETYKKQKSKDIDEYINSDSLIDYSVKEVKYKNPVFKNKKKFHEKLYDIFINRNLSKKIMGITNEEEEITNIKIEFSVNGSSKMVNYSTFFNLNVTADITNEIEVSKETGHPIKSSLFEKMFVFSVPYLEMLNIISEIDNNVNPEKKWDKIFYFKDNKESVEKVNDKDFSFSC